MIFKELLAENLEYLNVVFSESLNKSEETDKRRTK